MRRHLLSQPIDAPRLPKRILTGSVCSTLRKTLTRVPNTLNLQNKFLEFESSLGHENLRGTTRAEVMADIWGYSTQGLSEV